MTRYAPPSPALHGLADDVEGLLSKPWNDDDLLRTVRRLLRNRDPGDIPARRDAGFDWSGIRWAAQRTAWGFVQASRWLVGFLWMADAGGR
jgi:hypothetical protein